MLRQLTRFFHKHWCQFGTRLVAWWLRPTCNLPSVQLEALVPVDVKLKLPILDDVCLPPFYPIDDHDDFSTILRLVSHLQPRIVVEMGTAYGNLTANICQNCPATTVYTVNALSFNQTGRVVSYELDQEEIGRVYRKYGYAKQVVQIFENTLNLDLSQYLKGAKVDLAVIDACHDTDYVINDFLKVLPYMNENGIIMFHDTDPNLYAHLSSVEIKGHLTSSYLACMKLRQRGHGVYHIAGTWWAIWSNKSLSAANRSLDTKKTSLIDPEIILVVK